MKSDEGLTAEALRKHLRYDPKTGVFVWLVSRNSHMPAGTVAGTTRRGGYRVIGILGRQRPSHRLAWLYVHGEWPKGEVDHINRICGDNRIQNLRLATHAQNGANQPRRSDNTTGFKGVCQDKRCGRYMAKVVKNGVAHYFGYHDTPEAAHAAYCRGATELFGEFASPA